MKQKPHRFLSITSTLLALLTLMPSAYADPASEAPAPTAPATATTKDPALITEIANTLRRSDALMATFANAPSEEVTRQYLEAFASAMTIEQAEQFVEVTKDKHFEVTGTRDDGQPMVELTEGPPEVDSTSSESCCKCWRARVAFMAWWTAFYSMRLIHSRPQVLSD